MDLFTFEDDFTPPIPFGWPQKQLPPHRDGYFNTVGESGKDLSTYRAKAADQTDRVLAEMIRLGKASPSQVGRSFVSVPLTSIRRAMTVLTGRGLLVKTAERVVGVYGRNEHVWAIATSSSAA